MSGTTSQQLFLVPRVFRWLALCLRHHRGNLVALSGSRWSSFAGIASLNSLGFLLPRSSTTSISDSTSVDLPRSRSNLLPTDDKTADRPLIVYEKETGSTHFMIYHLCCSFRRLIELHKTNSVYRQRNAHIHDLLRFTVGRHGHCHRLPTCDPRR